MNEWMCQCLSWCFYESELSFLFSDEMRSDTFADAHVIQNLVMTTARTFTNCSERAHHPQADVFGNCGSNLVSHLCQ